MNTLSTLCPQLLVTSFKMRGQQGTTRTSCLKRSSFSGRHLQPCRDGLVERRVGRYCCLGCFRASLIMVNFDLLSRSKFSVFGRGEKENVGTGEMAHQLRVLATKCGDPSLEAIHVSSPEEKKY